MKHDTSIPKHLEFELYLTSHAKQRQQQRGVSENAIRITLLWGRYYHQGRGRTAYFLGIQEVKEAQRKGINLQGYQNIAVVQGQDGFIITVIRTSSPKKIRQLSFEKMEGGQV